MPVIDRQRRVVEVGHLRVGGIKGTNKPGKPLEAFRVTSRLKHVLDEVAKVYGGEVVPWTDERKTGYWQVFTDAPTIKAWISLKRLPNGDFESLSQWYEQWKGEKLCTHRCDGTTCKVWQKIGDKSIRVEVPCECDEEARACQLTSRLLVMLPEVRAFGVFRLDTNSTIFADETSGLIETLQGMLGQGYAPVTLTIEKRDIRTGPDEKTKTPTVVRLDFDTKPVAPALMANAVVQQAMASGSQALEALPAPAETEVVEAQIAEESHVVTTGGAVLEANEFRQSLSMGDEEFDRLKKSAASARKSWSKLLLDAKAKGVSDVAGIWEFANDWLYGGEKR